MADKCFKSMTDNLMEYAVVNFSEVFSVNRLKEISNSRKKMLLPYLFERILLKSKEMKWFIHIDNLLNVLPYRDLLQWKNIDLLTFRRHKVLDESILHQMSRVTYPIKSFSICLNILTDDGIRSLCAMGSTIESLQLHYRYRFFTDLPSIPFPRLKQLFLHYLKVAGRMREFLDIDFSCFAETLEKLRLENEYLADSTFMSLANLKNLKALSLPDTWAGYQALFPEVLGSLNLLRSLDIRDIAWRSLKQNENFPQNLFTAVSKMPNLENFDALCGPELIKPLMKCRKWKKLGSYSKLYQIDDIPTYDELKSSADKVFCMHDETLVPTFERYGTDVENPAYIIETLLNLLPRIPQDQMQPVENTLLDIVAHSSVRTLNVFINQFLDSNRCSQQFIKKFINVVFSYYDYDNAFEKIGTLTIPQRLGYINEEEDRRSDFYVHVTRQSVANYMRDVIKNNLSNSLRMKVLRGIFFVFYRENEMNYLGLNEIFETAIENNLIDEDALEAMLRIVDYINEEQYERLDGY